MRLFYDHYNITGGKGDHFILGDFKPLLLTMKQTLVK